MEYGESMRAVVDLLERGDLAGAREVLESILARYPGDRWARRIMAELGPGEARGQAPPGSWRPTAAHVPTLEEAVNAVRESISEVTSTPGHEIPVDGELLCEMGIDWVGYTHLAVVLEERFNVRINDADMKDLDSMTVRQIAGWITSPRGAH